MDYQDKGIIFDDMRYFRQGLDTLNLIFFSKTFILRQSEEISIL